MREVLREVGRTPPIETQVIGSHGEVLTYLLSTTRIELRGRPCVLSIAHDLTERRRLEEQLMHSQKMEAVGRLAGGIAHDFNNMLTVISGYSESLSERLEGEDRDDAIEIQEAARRSAQLTKQLLAFSRRQVLRSEVFDLNEVLLKMKALLRPLIGESIELRLDLGEGSEPVRADRGQLEQAIVNLAVNARDAMPRGGKLVLSSSTVNVAPGRAQPAIPTDLEPGTYARLCVTDDGDGMPADVAAHVMEPFFTTKPEGQGTGLGLSIVHGFARQCGGAVSLESEPGRGTCVSLFLPVAEGDLERASPRDSSEPLAREVADVRTALLVEDEPLLRRLTARTLERAGFEVVTAEDGQEGLDRARELGDRLDLLVSDVVMPRISGIELCRRLREARPRLPVILMSGYPEPASGERRLPDDVEFVQKPFDEQTLSKAAAAALEADQDVSDV
jgi:signal transduction histidine kinase/ActR/RegA family two-component response regulator